MAYKITYSDYPTASGPGPIRRGGKGHPALPGPTGPPWARKANRESLAPPGLWAPRVRPAWLAACRRRPRTVRSTGARVQHRGTRRGVLPQFRWGILPRAAWAGPTTGGSGDAVGDVITLTGGATIAVQTLAGSAVASFLVQQSGSYT